MHEQLRVGQIVQALAPRNLFPLHETDEPALLIAGGIGITPLLCMAHAMERMGREWHMVYAVRNRDAIAFESVLRRWPDRVAIHVDDEQGGPSNLAAMIEPQAKDVHLYCCGPGPMLDAFERAVIDRPARYVHLERFGVDLAGGVPRAGFSIKLARSNVELSVREGQTILEVLEKAGVAAPSSCGQGVCGVCETRVIDGVPDHRDALLSKAERDSNAVMLICCSRAKSPSLTLDL